VKVEVKGAAAKINAIFLFDKSAWRDIQRGVKRATDAITQDARSRVPPMGIVPMGGGLGYGPWNHFGRDFSYNKGAFHFSTRFRSRSKAGFRQVEGRSLLDVSEASVAVYTLAGFVAGPNPQTRYKARSRSFKNTLNRQSGTRPGARGQGMWPRLLTPAYHAHGPIAARTIGQLIEEAVAKINRT
jgi:hypothetical protein